MLHILQNPHLRPQIVRRVRSVSRQEARTCKKRSARICIAYSARSTIVSKVSDKSRSGENDDGIVMGTSTSAERKHSLRPSVMPAGRKENGEQVQQNAEPVGKNEWRYLPCILIVGL